MRPQTWWFKKCKTNWNNIWNELSGHEINQELKIARFKTKTVIIICNYYFNIEDNDDCVKNI